METTKEKQELITLNNSYVRHLAILDHLKECQIIADAIKEQKNKEIEDKSQTLKNLEFHYGNELADLFILLSYECKKETIERRIEKFKENAKKDADN